MNSKKLLIAFTAVSIAALIVSSFAVFAVARTYSAALVKDRTEIPGEDIASPEISTSVPDESEPCETVAAPPTDTETSAPATTTAEATSPDVTTEAEDAATTEAVGFTLSLSDSRLVITSPDGESVYERIIDESDLRAKDREALLTGIDFADIDTAMSAVYDLIS